MYLQESRVRKGGVSERYRSRLDKRKRGQYRSKVLIRVVKIIGISYLETIREVRWNYVVKR